MGYSDAKIVRNSLFLRVEPGSPRTIRLIDENPTEQWQHNIDNKLVVCVGQSCLDCADGHSKPQRFVTNVWDHNDQRVMLWSYGPTVGEALKTIALNLEKDGENIMNHDLELNAQGSGVQKKTSVQLRIKSREIPTGLRRLKIGSKDGDIPF